MAEVLSGARALDGKPCRTLWNVDDLSDGGVIEYRLMDRNAW
jgi:hypothetical protein